MLKLLRGLTSLTSRTIGYAHRQVNKVRTSAKQHRYSISEYGRCNAEVDISIIISTSDCFVSLMQCLNDFSGMTVEYIVTGKQLPPQLLAQLEQAGSSFKHVRFNRVVPSSVARNKAVDCSSGRWLLFINVGSLPPTISLRNLLQAARAPNVGIVGQTVKANDGQLWQGLGIGYDGNSGPLIPICASQKIVQSKSSPVAIIPGFLFCSRELFLSAHSFDERLDNGFEEIGLCWSIAQKQHKNIAAIEASTIPSVSPHALEIISARAKGSKRFYTIYNPLLQRQRIENCLRPKAAGLHSDFTIGLVVTDDAKDTMAGDVFTARDLAVFFTEELGWNVRFLPRLSKTVNWYDAADLDCILVLLDNYDIRKLKNKRPGLITVAWLRNWFQKWVKRRWFDQFDLALCSSELAAKYVTERSPLRAEVMRIASNSKRFNPNVEPRSDLASDYCFTGSYWRAPREIENYIPDQDTFKFAIYGSGWKKHANFTSSWRGELPYEQLPAVYTSSKLLIDDANHVTKPWGSVNSRVFDALASGILVLTNGAIGAKETFGDDFPCYDGVEELESKIQYFLTHPRERMQLAAKLHNDVLQRHTYRHRAQEFKKLLQSRFVAETRIAIKIAVPHRREAKQWGDFHFAESLAVALEKLGYPTRIDILPEWYCEPAQRDDVVIVIRGLEPYVPSPNQLNLLWQISHPDKVEDCEYELYDHVFVASELYTTALQQRLKTPVTALLQCTDAGLFYYDPTITAKQGLLFVGNSRKQYRPAVRLAIEATLPISVYGSHWQPLINPSYLKGEHIENRELRGYYSEAGILLNDHWDSMRQHGFISNRLFDAAACGTVVVSDKVEGIEAIFHGLVYQFDPEQDDFAEVVERAYQEAQTKSSERLRLAEEVAQHHSFDARAVTIVKVISSTLLTAATDEACH